MHKKYPNLYIHARQFVKYGMVGACGTLTHYGWLIILSTVYPDVNPAYFAFSGAFLGAVVNYILNYHFTFGSSKRHLMAMPQFLLLAGLNMIISSLIVNLAVSYDVHYIVGQIVATIIIVPLSFIISKKVVFK